MHCYSQEWGVQAAAAQDADEQTKHATDKNLRKVERGSGAIMAGACNIGLRFLPIALQLGLGRHFSDDLLVKRRHDHHRHLPAMGIEVCVLPSPAKGFSVDSLCLVPSDLLRMGPGNGTRSHLLPQRGCRYPEAYGLSLNTHIMNASQSH